MTNPRGTNLASEDPRTDNGLPPERDRTFAENNFESSWGETRTPDPGIMSAVL